MSPDLSRVVAMGLPRDLAAPAPWPVSREGGLRRQQRGVRGSLFLEFLLCFRRFIDQCNGFHLVLGIGGSTECPELKLLRHDCGGECRYYKHKVREIHQGD